MAPPLGGAAQLEQCLLLAGGQNQNRLMGAAWTAPHYTTQHGGQEVSGFGLTGEPESGPRHSVSSERDPQYRKHDHDLAVADTFSNAITWVWEGRPSIIVSSSGVLSRRVPRTSIPRIILPMKSDTSIMIDVTVRCCTFSTTSERIHSTLCHRQPFPTDFSTQSWFV